MLVIMWIVVIVISIAKIASYICNCRKKQEPISKMAIALSIVALAMWIIFLFFSLP